MNKYLKLLILIVLVTALGFGLYFILFRENRDAITGAVQEIINPILSGGAEQPDESDKSEPAKRLVKISDLDVFAYWQNSKTGSFYMVNNAGQIIRKTEDSEEPDNLQGLNRLNAAYPSPDGVYAVFKFNYPSLPSFSIYNTQNSGWQPLPFGTQSASWAPTGNRLAYLDQSAIKILDLNTNKTTEVIKLNQKDAEIFWQNESRILLTLKSDFLTSIYAVDINRKTISLMTEEAGMRISWLDPNAYGIKLNTFDNRNSTSLIDPSGSKLSDLAFVTFPEKCTADIQSKIIYCAIPKNIPPINGVVDEYYMRGLYTDDALYFINLADGSYGEIMTNTDILIDATDLKVKNNSLYLINRLDDGLYVMPL